MSKIEDGGPSFVANGVPDPDNPDNALYGMSLRDWFAGQALGVAMKNVPFRHPTSSWDGSHISIDSPSGREQTDKWRKALAAEAYKLADAMLAERDK